MNTIKGISLSFWCCARKPPREREEKDIVQMESLEVVGRRRSSSSVANRPAQVPLVPAGDTGGGVGVGSSNPGHSKERTFSRRDDFLSAQTPVYEGVKRELLNGQKHGHWMWFIFPQLAGLGSSSTARRFGLKDEAEAAAYWADADLRHRLKECANLVLQLPEGKSVHQVFGAIDVMKLRSCMTLFDAVTEGEPIFREVLNRHFADQGPCPLTLKRLGTS